MGKLFSLFGRLDFVALPLRSYSSFRLKEKTMKIISLFTKAPTHQRFTYRPRYYDPSKDEMLERENRIRKEIERERGISHSDAEYRSRIAGSFQAARKRSKPSAQTGEVVMRLAVLLFLTLLLIAFFQWGKSALYIGLAFVPVYLYLRFKGMKKNG
jgi:hypothetical protein